METCRRSKPNTLFPPHRCAIWFAGFRRKSRERTRRAAESLRYRDFLTVMLILKERNMFDDNWIYIHDPSVKVGRVQNFRSWSPEMVPDPDKACYGLEYFCFEGRRALGFERRRFDRAWQTRADPNRSGQGGRCCRWLTVVRQKKAYPVYDDDYACHVATIRQELEDSLSELASRWSQRHAQVQQPRPRHDDRDVVRGKYSGRRQALRSLAGQCRRRVPRTR